MNPNPFSGLLHSRKFWLGMLDLILGVATYFLSKYAPDVAEDVKFVFAAVQPVLLTIIAAIAYEDVAMTKAAATVEGSKAFYDKLAAATDKDK